MQDRLRTFALVFLRLALGAILIAHGKMKVFGGMGSHQHMVASIGLPPWMAYLSAGTEFFGGILLIIGLLTRLAGLAVAIEMLVAILRVHLKHGLAGQGGYDFPLLVGTVGFALMLMGAGPISLDWLFGGRTAHK